jgi:hypothetical protein
MLSDEETEDLIRDSYEMIMLKSKGKAKAKTNKRVKKASKSMSRASQI